MISFYEDEQKKILDSNLLTNKAEAWAREFASRGLSPTQIRKFYNDVKALESKIEAKKDEPTGFKEVLPLIKMLKSKVAYAVRLGGQQRVPFEFKRFIDEMIESINDEKDFEAFCKVFEATLGFFYGKSKRR